ncbi:hypothetical protein F5X68DRAFT_243976 [Plectosphaerella plurivora]|uniref:F-box domain-containing protein n=1 Tax=Plectosphaerella plurivora TaxID=936078 RepID=A0A9P9AFL0_9PEZI|nr:hypothetical protein F5X68DRAFT_243976 [Plectosphaerella plurivora]
MDSSSPEEQPLTKLSLITNTINQILQHKFSPKQRSSEQPTPEQPSPEQSTPEKSTPEQSTPKQRSSENMKLSLDQLPVDILDIIIEMLNSPKLRTPLASVNKKLHALLQPIIFKTILMLWGTKESPRQISHLLRSLQENPQLRELVKIIRIVPCSPFFESSPNDKIPVKNMGPAIDTMFDNIGGAKDIMVDALGSLEKDTGAVRALAKKGDTRAIVPLLATTLPHLERLLLTGHIAAQQNLLGSFILACVNHATESGDMDKLNVPLASLKHVELMLDYHWGYNYKITGVAATYLAFFYLPRLETMTVHAVYKGPQKWPSEQPPVATCLRYLEVETYHNEGRYIVNMMIRVCPALKTIKWTHLWGENDHKGFSLTAISSVLQAAAGQLDGVILCLARSSGKMGSMFGPFLVDIERPETFVTGRLILAPLVHATRLTLTWVHLFGLAASEDVQPGPSTFPPNLEVLSIRASRLITQEHLFWQMFSKVRVAREFVGKCRLYAPRLRVCEFGLGVFVKHPLEDLIKRDLIHAGETQGVKVTFHPECFASPTLFPPARGDDSVLPNDWKWLVRDDDKEEKDDEEVEVDEVD